MGELELLESRQFSVRLMGIFSLLDPNGAEIAVSDKKGRALIAMLATSPGMRRSREWLKSRLWSRSEEPNCSNSLRQTVYGLKQVMKPWEDVLISGHEFIRLSNVTVAPIDPVLPEIEFFEDAPALDEPFEDWLRQERASVARNLDNTPQHAAKQNECSVHFTDLVRSAPCIAIGDPTIIAESARAAVIGERICNLVCDTFLLNEFIDIYDIRGGSATQAPFLDKIHSPNLQACIETRVSLIDAELQVSIVARRPTNGRVMWSSTLTSDQTSVLGLESEQIIDFVNSTVVSIEQALFRNAAREISQSPNMVSGLYTSVRQLFSLSKSNVDDASAQLNDIASDLCTPGSLAWAGFAAMLRAGENIDAATEAAQDEAERLVTLAMEADPNHALALAMAGHYHAFYRRDLEYAATLLSNARNASPQSPFVWDSLAMHSMYANNPEQGAIAADTAARIGRHSPHSFYFDASVAIAATLNRKHDQAVRIGERILATRPRFLGLMRHVCASLVEIGAIDRAYQIFQQIREHDPAFGTTEMSSLNYHLPSDVSRAVISESLKKIGLLES